MRALLAQLASSAVLLPPLAVPVPARAQVEVIIQGGVYLADVAPARQAQQQASAGRTNIGGLAMMAAILRLDTRAALRLDAQQYLFSGDIDDSYTPHLGTTPVHAPGARLRHDFVLLAGMSWRAH